MASLIKRLQDKADWFNGKWNLDQKNHPNYENTGPLLEEAIARIKQLEALEFLAEG